MKVFHGGTDVIDSPLADVGRANLDFGPGFYVTDMYAQAIEWAKKVSIRRRLAPVVNCYELQRDSFSCVYRCKVFLHYDAEWLDFIVDSRLGKQPWKQYDYIEGGIADDRVVDTINLYMADLMTREKALERLSKHRPNNQMCFLSQSLIDKYLVYYGTDRI